MKEFLRESIIDSFNVGFMAVTKGDFVRTPVTGVKLRRSEELDLIFELTSRGWNREGRSAIQRARCERPTK